MIAVYLFVRTETWHKLLSSMRSAAVLYLCLFVAVILCEAYAGARLSRYLSRNFLNDMLYSLFYLGGIYHLFIYQPFFEALRPRLAILDLHLLGRMPAYWAFPIYVVISDLFGYWIHRLQHTRYFWPFHSVHHSQEQLTFASFYRFHFVDQFMANTAAIVPLMLLGAPPRLWLPIRFLQWFLQAIQHSELNWRMGPFQRVICGPVFHSIHHSPEARFFNKNFGMALSVWDFLFGTAVEAQVRCRVCGVEGLAMPETIHGQFSLPFRMAYAQFTGKNGSRSEEANAAQELKKAV
jgi:sterol desaturase/sphingolipid hydroxylase (fatty acid hydroxylase superfamily)